MKEDTSSSISCRNFGHYKAIKDSDYVTHFQALQASLVMHHGLVLETAGEMGMWPTEDVWLLSDF